MAITYYQDLLKYRGFSCPLELIGKKLGDVIAAKEFTYSNRACTKIPKDMLMSDLLAHSGVKVPMDMIGKTFYECALDTDDPAVDIPITTNLTGCTYKEGLSKVTIGKGQSSTSTTITLAGSDEGTFDSVSIKVDDTEQAGEESGWKEKSSFSKTITVTRSNTKITITAIATKKETEPEPEEGD